MNEQDWEPEPGPKQKGTRCPNCHQQQLHVVRVGGQQVQRLLKCTNCLYERPTEPEVWTASGH